MLEDSGGPLAGGEGGGEGERESWPLHRERELCGGLDCVKEEEFELSAGSGGGGGTRL